MSDDIKRRFEAKMTELKKARSVKNPERARKRQAKKVAKKAATKHGKSNNTATKSDTSKQQDNKADDSLVLKAKKADKIIVSKIDPSQEKKKKPVIPKNPKQALAKLESHSSRLAKLDEQQRQTRTKDETWVKAIQKAQGLIVKDDKKKVIQSLKREEKIKKKSKKNWSKRKYQIRNEQEKKQEKRQANIRERIETKKSSNDRKRRQR